MGRFNLVVSNVGNIFSVESCLTSTAVATDIHNPVFQVILGINYTVRVVSEVLER